jgi:hypothetical protein
MLLLAPILFPSEYWLGSVWPKQLSNLQAIWKSVYRQGEGAGAHWAERVGGVCGSNLSPAYIRGSGIYRNNMLGGGKTMLRIRICIGTRIRIQFAPWLWIRLRNAFLVPATLILVPKGKIYYDYLSFQRKKLNFPVCFSFLPLYTYDKI